MLLLFLLLQNIAGGVQKELISDGNPQHNEIIQMNDHLHRSFSERTVTDLSGKWGTRTSIDYINYEILKKLEVINRRTIRVRIIGKTTLNKNIYALEIQHSIHKGATVFIDAAQNGNQWESVNFAIYIINHLLANKVLLLWLKFVIIPIVNPDGYEVSERNKSFATNVNPDRTCPGVNIARNFDVGTRPEFVSCAIYQGTEYNSEVETRNIISYFKELGDVKLYLTLHSGEAFVAHPYADNEEAHNSSAMATNMYNVIKDLMKLSKIRVGSLTMMRGEKYGGSALDWAARVMKVRDCIYLSVDSKAKDFEGVFKAYFEGIKYAILQLQMTDTGVGLAFSREANSSGCHIGLNVIVFEFILLGMVLKEVYVVALQ